MAPAPSTLVSPLKQVNADPASVPRKPKLQTSWDKLTQDPAAFAGQSTSQITSFFAELFCLTPTVKIIEDSLDRLEISDLLGPYKANITLVFTQAVKTFREADRDDSRRTHVVDTLIPFLRNLLSRRFSNYSFEVMTLLAGSLERSDSVFTDLVSAIDLTLQDVYAPTALRHRTLQLALVIVSSINQGSITAYFLRRDLFSTLVNFMTDDATAPFAFESTLLLGLLANFRKYEARNPYGVRIEDFVEEGVMSRIIDVVSTVSHRARDSYISITDDSPPSFVASLTSLVFSFRFSELLSGFSMSLPPPPSPSVRYGSVETPPAVSASASAPTTPSLKGKEKEKEEPSINGSAGPTPVTSPVLPSSPLQGDGAASLAAEAAAIANAGAGAGAGNEQGAPKAVQPKREEKSSSENAFKKMPPEIVAILLPFYDLLNLNKAFCALVFNDTSEGATPHLPPAIISLTSYVLCHAASSSRARAYARLCLLILFMLVEEGEGNLMAEAEVRLCRQRIPMLAHDSSPRPLLAAMLDTAAIFLRHNLRKRLDVDTYIVCLRLVQRIMQQLKTEKARLAYEWTPVWRSILSLAGFVVSRIDDLRLLSNNVDTLISQIFIVLSYPAYWGEHFFPTSHASALLHYELLHADATLSALSDLLGISSVSTPHLSPNPGSQATLGPSPARANIFALSPAKTSFSSIAGSHGRGARFVATECISNVRSLITHLKVAIEGGAPGQAQVDMDEVDPEEILRIIEANLGELS
ncbi:hypothetical protein BCR35DRAFT_328230 [Leucosporidium creatinivorum]|uniref:Armadillo-like helical domain-containing protein n=1 Tax=Leucosporidium creatinivorum TaxID=106004 RepID=A0A1Y2G2N4_9BASI|nr:hypothetical protein BCR35DRAFT_328230 [Leucosporidium creatinivorum]